MKKKLIVTLLILVMVVASLAACNSGKTGGGSGGGTASGKGPDGRAYADNQVFRTLYSSEMTTYNYLASGTTYELEVGANTIDSLVENDTYGNIVPCAAESWETSEDGLTWTFHLRKGCKWYDKDGNEKGDVTARDFVAAAQYVCDSNNDASNSYLMDGWIENAGERLEYTAAEAVAVDKGSETVAKDEDGEWEVKPSYVKDSNGDYLPVDVEVNEAADTATAVYGDPIKAVKAEDLGVVAKDDYTLEYHLVKVRPYFLTVLQFGTYWPAPAELLEQYGADFALDNTKMWFDGAYILQTAEPQQKRVYVKNENNWDAEHVYIEKIEETYNTEAATLAPTMFLRGDIDSASIGSDIVSDWLSDPEKSNMVCTSRVVGDYSYFFGFNFEPKFDAQYQPENWVKAVNNENFRQAVFHAIDRETYLKARFPGDDPAMHLINTITPRGFATNEGKDYVTYGDLAEINETDSFNKELALEYRDKAKEELTAAGASFPIIAPLNFNPSSPAWGNASVVLEQQLEELLGKDFIDVQVITFAGNSFLNETRRNGNYAIQELNWGADFMDPETWADPFDRENSYNFFCHDTDTYRVNQDTKSAETNKLIDDYFDMVDAAREEVKDIDSRYEAFAKAEAFYINHAVVVPCFISGGSYQATKLNAFEGQFAMMGQSSSRYKGQHVYDEAMSQAMYDEQYAAWQEKMSK